MIKDIALILFGWLLAILAQVITSWFSSRKRREEIREGINTELGQLRYRLGTLALQVSAHQGMIDRPLIEWFKSIASSHRNIGSVETSLAHLVDQVLAADSEELATIGARFKSPEGVSLVFLKYGTPFLEANLSQLTDLPPKTHAKLLEVQAQVTFFHGQVDEANYLHHLTFDESLGETNRARIQENIRQIYLRIGQLAKTIADVIGPVPLQKRHNLGRRDA